MTDDALMQKARERITQWMHEQPHPNMRQDREELVVWRIIALTPQVESGEKSHQWRARLVIEDVDAATKWPELLADFARAYAAERVAEELEACAKIAAHILMGGAMIEKDQQPLPFISRR